LALAGVLAGCGGDDSAPGGSAGSGGSGGSGGTGGSGGSDAGTEVKITSSMGDWDVYRDPYGDGRDNPIMTIMGSADAFEMGTGMRVKLTVAKLPATRAFGSHIHKLDCSESKAGGHYQNNPAPDGGANDPKYGNPTNEVWLDFVTDANGAATAEASVAWVPRKGEAKAVIIHDMTTMDGGLAGAKLACIKMPF